MSTDRVKLIKENPKLLFLTLGHRGFFNWMSDEKYLRKAFKIRMGRELELDNPQTYSDKLQWLKLYDRKPIYTQMVDKYEVKKLVAERIGEQFVIPTIGVWNHFDEIDFDRLPDQFVIKCTHDSGGLIICKDKNKLNKAAAKRKIEGCLKHNFFWGQREWPYKNVQPRIIAEPYLEDIKTHELRDYKFFTFDGEVKALFIATERSGKEETKFDFFDADGKLLPFTNGHPHANPTPALPICFEEMKQLASELGRGIPQVRVDFYEVNGRVYFGELTFFHWSGMVPYEPEEWDYKFGSWIELPQKTLSD
jgi:hypothetical protein